LAKNYKQSSLKIELLESNRTSIKYNHQKVKKQ